MIGFVGGEIARYHAFTGCFAALNVPARTRMYSGLGYDVSYNRNHVIEDALKHPETQWVQLWDDDHVFAPDVLIRLLDHGVDVVAPIYAQRQPPFHPCIYKEENTDGSFSIFTWKELEGKDGLLPITSAGAGGLLIRRHVLEAIPEPWFERQGKIGEDHLFLKKCREAGFGVYAALDVPIGHMSTVEIWPHSDGSRWCGKVALSSKVSVEYWDASYAGQV